MLPTLDFYRCVFKIMIPNDLIDRDIDKIIFFKKTNVHRLGKTIILHSMENLVDLIVYFFFISITVKIFAVDSCRNAAGVISTI